MHTTIEVHRSDLEKIQDTLRVAYEHHSTRDRANAALHLAEMVRFSPLTSELGAQLDRINGLLGSN